MREQRDEINQGSPKAAPGGPYLPLRLGAYWTTSEGYFRFRNPGQSLRYSDCGKGYSNSYSPIPSICPEPHEN